MTNGMNPQQIQLALAQAGQQEQLAKLMQQREQEYLGQFFHSTTKDIYARLVSRRYSGEMSDELLKEFAANAERAAIVLMKQFWPGFTVMRQG